MDRFPTIFDMASGPRRSGYLAWLNAVSNAAALHRLKLAFQAWEPRLTSEAGRTLPGAWQCPARDATSGKALCVSQPEARDWLLRGFDKILKAAPGLDTLVLGCEDNDAILCDERCPRCGSRPKAERWGELYRDIQTTCRRVRPGFQIVLFEWWWPNDYFEAIFSRVAEGTPILTQMERGAPYTPDPTHPEWCGHVFDQSLACETPGPDFARAQEVAHRHGGCGLRYAAGLCHVRGL
jgi:hypothetical protein